MIRNDEARMTNFEGMKEMTKLQNRGARDDFFVIRASSLFRHSPFAIRHSPRSSFVLRHFP